MSAMMYRVNGHAPRSVMENFFSDIDWDGASTAPQPSLTATKWTMENDVSDFPQSLQTRVIYSSYSENTADWFGRIFAEQSSLTAANLDSYLGLAHSTSPRVDDVEDRVISTLSEIYAKAEFSTKVDLLRSCFNAVEGAFARSDLKFLNRLLEKIETANLPPIASLGIARSTSRARKYLPSWAGYVADVNDHLTAKHENVPHLMRGLLVTDGEASVTAKPSVL